MKTLITSFRPSYCSETIEYNGNKFKITSQNGNSYFFLTIELYTPNGLAKVACAEDIQDSQKIDYVWDALQRLSLGKKNLKVAERYIKAVF